MDWLILHLIVGLLVAETCRRYRLRREKDMARSREQHRFAVSAYLLLFLAWPLIVFIAIVSGVMTKVSSQ